MELTLIDNDAAITHVRLDGRLDAAGADAIGLRFTAAVAAQERPALIDLSAVSFVASMGLRLLVSAARALKLKGLPMVLYGLQPQVLELMEDAGMTQLLAIEPSLAEARRRLEG